MNLFFKTLMLLMIFLLSLLLLQQTGLIELHLGDDVTNIAADDDDDDDEVVGVANDNDDAEDEDEDKISIIGGYKAVKIDDDIIEAAGIQTDKLYSINFKPEFSAFAEVVDVSQIMLLKQQYNDLLADKGVLESQLFNDDKILKRAVALHKANSLTTRELEQQRAIRDAKAAELRALSAKIANLKFTLRANWGEGVSDIVLSELNQTVFEQLVNRDVSLVLLSLFKDQRLNPAWQDVFINHKNQRTTAILASYLDKANRVTNPLYGESYFYLLNSDSVRTGMRLFAWVEQTGGTLGGLFIPESAVVWYANQPWIYTLHDDGLFVRRPLDQAKRISTGWLDQKQQFEASTVVIQGSQTVLSEEFKWAIPDEDDD